MSQFRYTDYLPEKEDMMTPGAAGFTRFPSDVFSGARVNDSFAAMGSAVRNLGDKTLFAPVDSEGVVVSQQAGTLALQNANDVSITGGILGQVRGASPVGATIFWHASFRAYLDNYTILLLMGWVIADGRTVINPYTETEVTAPNLVNLYPRFGTSNALSVFGSDTQTTADAGLHSHGATTALAGVHLHGGTTGGTSITEAQLPSTVLTEVTISGSGGSVGAGTATINRTRPGTDSPHNHTIAADGGHAHDIGADGVHAHTVTVTPLSVYLIPLARIF